MKPQLAHAVLLCLAAFVCRADVAFPDERPNVFHRIVNWLEPMIPTIAIVVIAIGIIVDYCTRGLTY